METLIIFFSLQIPVAIFAVAGFKHWRKVTTHQLAQRICRKHPEAHQAGIAIRKFGIVLYEVPVCAATLRLYKGKK